MRDMNATAHPKLEAAFTEHRLFKKGVAEIIGCGRTTLYFKLLGQIPWNSAEMFKLMDVLGIDPEEMHIYFPYISPDQLLARWNTNRDAQRAKMRKQRMAK